MLNAKKSSTSVGFHSRTSGLSKKRPLAGSHVELMIPDEDGSVESVKMTAEEKAAAKRRAVMGTGEKRANLARYIEAFIHRMTFYDFERDNALDTEAPESAKMQDDINM